MPQNRVVVSRTSSKIPGCNGVNINKSETTQDQTSKKELAEGSESHLAPNESLLAMDKSIMTANERIDRLLQDEKLTYSLIHKLVVSKLEREEEAMLRTSGGCKSQDVGGNLERRIKKRKRRLKISKDHDSPHHTKASPKPENCSILEDVQQWLNKGNHEHWRYQSTEVNRSASASTNLSTFLF